MIHLDNIKKITTLVLGGTAGMAAMTGTLLTNNMVHAGTTALDNVSVSIPLSCTMGGEVTSEHTTTLIGGQYKNNIGSTTLTTYCNDPQGFSIYAVGYTDDILGNNVMTGSDGAPDINAGIATTGNTSAWGMKVSPVAGAYTMTLGTGLTTNSDGYYAIPSDFTKVAHLNTATGLEGAASSNLTTTYFIYAAGTQPAGSYKGQVAYTLVHPYTKDAITLEQAFTNAGKSKVTVDGKEYYTMQDMTPAICADASVYGELSQVQLVDARDNKLYWATKLEDDHCWMTQNLDFDVPTTALSSTTTDLTSFNVGGYTTANGYTKNESTGEITWTPVRETIDASTISLDNVDATFSDWTDDYYTPYSVNVGEWYADGAWYDSDEECFAADGGDIWDGYGNCENHIGKTPYATNGTHGAFGNYYNWSAAVAANNTNVTEWKNSTFSNTDNNPQNSICPAGWRLPTISSQANTTPNSTNEFGRLNYLYNGGRDDNDSGLFNAPIYLPRAGITYSGEVWFGGYDGSYWSSSVYDASRAYFLYFYSSGVYPENGSGRNFGFSVRCVAR